VHSACVTLDTYSPITPPGIFVVSTRGERKKNEMFIVLYQRAPQACQPICKASKKVGNTCLMLLIPCSSAFSGSMEYICMLRYIDNWHRKKICFLFLLGETFDAVIGLETLFPQHFLLPRAPVTLHIRN
jgi:hypothetical protein